ncbi:MAG: hypothetical protein BA865_07335 [Desulfobacterales bacterium S5133MH4]|nr:MAG: hypothetical protein BA865_07335 [Desulfobacterales bacterium S5133MH4]
MSIDILVFVNQDFDSDSRVNRAVRFLAQHGYRIAVASRTSKNRIGRRADHEWGRLYYFRQFKAGRLSWLGPLVCFASAETKRTDGSGVRGGHLRCLKHFLRDLLYLGQLFNLLLLNLRLVFRFYSLPVKLYYPNDFDVLGAAGALAWLHQKPLVYETHELYVDQLSAYPAWYRRTLMLLEGWWAKRSINVITVGEYIASTLHERYRLDSQPTVIRSCPPYQRVTKVSHLKYPVKLLYHGAYHPERGLEQSILAMHHIDNAHLYLRGFGYWEKPLRDLVNKEKLESKVTFLAPVPMKQVVEAAAPFDIGVGAFQDVSLNSRYCLPNKIFEYLMAGLALAVSDLPELRRIVNGYNVGVTFDPSDPADIARQVRNLLADPDLLHQMQSNALGVARDVFKFESEGEKLVGIIEDIIGRGSRCAE